MKLEIKSQEYSVTAEILLDGKPLEKVRWFTVYHDAGKPAIFTAELLPQITELIEEETEVFLRVGTRVFKVKEEVEE